MWDTCIHDLEEEVWFLDHAPKLFPDFYVLFEWGDGQFDVVFFHCCDVSAPLQKGHVFLLMNFMSSHLLVPCWSPWDLQRSILRIDQALWREELVNKALVTFGWNNCIATQNLLRWSFSLKLSLRHLCKLDEFFKRILIQYRLQLRPRRYLLQVRRVLLDNKQIIKYSWIIKLTTLNPWSVVALFNF